MLTDSRRWRHGNNINKGDEESDISSEENSWLPSVHFKDEKLGADDVNNSIGYCDEDSVGLDSDSYVEQEKMKDEKKAVINKRKKVKFKRVSDSPDINSEGNFVKKKKIFIPEPWNSEECKRHYDLYKPDFCKLPYRFGEEYHPLMQEPMTKKKDLPEPTYSIHRRDIDSIPNFKEFENLVLDHFLDPDEVIGKKFIYV